MDGCRLPMEGQRAPLPESIGNRQSRLANAFSLVEILVVVALLSLIILALMAVFGSTQNAFRSSITQTDVLQGGRSAMDMIAADLKEVSPSDGFSNGPVNFSVYFDRNYGPTYSLPLVQTLPTGGGFRTNVLESVFFLTLENQTWTGIGYRVDFTNSRPINGLYRFSASTNIHVDPIVLFTAFTNAAASQMSHVLDGVIDFRVRVYDTNGVWMTNGYPYVRTFENMRFGAGPLGEPSVYMFSNALPAAVEVELGVLEDRTLQRVDSIPVALVRSNYMATHSGQTHIFRQRVSIPNVDPAAYQ